jgi:hypothetical protein
MPRRFPLALLCAASVLLCGCTKGDLRALNAIADSEPVDVSIADDSATINGLAFGQAGSASDIPTGNHRVLLKTDTDRGQVTFAAESTPVAVDRLTTVYAVGRIAAGTQAALVLQVQDLDVPDGQAEVQFINAAAGQTGALDVYVSNPGSVLAGQTPRASFLYATVTEPLRIAAGTYEIRVTSIGNPANVIYDSGPNGIELAGGSSRQITLADHLGTSVASPLLLLVLPRSGDAFSIAHNGS